jgi:hypothetical protein
MADWYEMQHKLHEGEGPLVDVFSAEDGIGFAPDPERQRMRLPFGVWESELGRMPQETQARPASPPALPSRGLWIPGTMWAIPGPYTGMGPAGYQRSDALILEDVCERLTRHGWIDASQIEVDVCAGKVTLRGQVTGRAELRMAQATAQDVPGVKQVNNHLRVHANPRADHSD